MTFGLLGMKSPSLSGMINGIKADFSREALHQKFTEQAEKFMSKVFNLVLDINSQVTNSLKLKIFDVFSHIYICDSSSWKLSDGLAKFFTGFGEYTKSACKLQVVYDYKKSRFKSFELQNGIDPDLNYHSKLSELMTKGSLLIVDLGYYSIEMFQKIASKGAFFVSRLMIRSKVVYTPCGEAFKYAPWLKKQKKRNIETDIMLKDKEGNSVNCRLIAMKVDKNIAEKRRAKHKKKCHQKRNKGKPRQFNLDMCDWILIVTNIPKSKMPAQLIYPLYRLRWQIELIFKQLKSTLQIHKTDSSNLYRLKCELWGRLIAALMVHHVHQVINNELWNSKKQELSFEKLWKRIQERAFQFMERLVENTHEAIKYIHDEITRLWQSCIKTTHKTKPTSLEKLRNTRKFFNYIPLT